MPKLTKRMVDAATDGTAQVLLWDTGVKGFGLRVTPAGATSGILNCRDRAGQSRRHTIGQHGSSWTCEEARAEAVELLRDLSAGIDPLAADDGAAAGRAVVDRFDRWRAWGPAGRKPPLSLETC